MSEIGAAKSELPVSPPHLQRSGLAVGIRGPRRPLADSLASEAASLFCALILFMTAAAFEMFTNHFRSIAHSAIPK
ncbi:hypothetical protein AAFF_G00399440 [Aldrovandia affinis]|uniref:Uncharacterized protein n=1 Tax=Aldrovandia affinis TaxID=143900 RepID=A0AAD7SCU9_9TELE|nr:hypothetical protein AAFF_G00399440 [Aldrovandia affinis]